MKTKIHAAAGMIGFLTILTFWTSTAWSELFGSPEMIASVKAMILKGMFILIPAMAIVGGSGMSLGGKRTDNRAMAKKKRMPFIGANGLLILVPAAIYLESKASVGAFDTWFYAIQALELVAGATNLTLMGLNIRDGLMMTGRISSPRPQVEAAQMSTIIETRNGGPLVAKELKGVVDTDGKAMEPKPVMALCRCGASKNKPFCDGSHNEIEFSTEVSDERSEDRLRPYEGKDITVHYNRVLCSHAGECGKLGKVFDTSRKPWIDPNQGNVEDIIKVVTICPSGALSYSLSGEKPQHVVDSETGVTIEKNGPYRVVGVPLAEPRLGDGACPDKYVLCRCGASKNKPYCDGSHYDIGWKE